MLFTARTYTVASDATATVDEIGAAFAARINADTNAYFSATYTAGSDVLAITADNAGFGPLNIVAPTGATIADATAWVEPVGTVSQVQAYFPNMTLGSASYSRYIIRYRKPIRSNIVNGLEVYKPVNALVFIDSTDTTAIALLTSILNGSYATVADYLGCPAV